jgi:hypothetical protein
MAAYGKWVVADVGSADVGGRLWSVREREGGCERCAKAPAAVLCLI